MREKAVFHLPGLFEFYDFYLEFLKIYSEHKEYFYDWCEIASLYGAPEGCIWGGGRFGEGDIAADEILDFLESYGISARLTFSNSLLREEHLTDRKCNQLCAMLESGEAGYVATPNPEIVYAAVKDPTLKPLLDGANETDFDKSKLHVVAKFTDALDELRQKCDKDTVVIFENDLPDTYAK